MTGLSLTNSQTVVYQKTSVIDKNSLKEETEIDVSDYTEEELADHLMYEAKITKWIDDQAEKEAKERYYYTPGKRFIRYRRKIPRPDLLFNEEWILIDRNNRTMNHYYIHNDKGAQMTEFPFDRSSFRDLDASYEVREDRDDKMTILGYQCHRIVVIETIIDPEFGTEVREYDMYATSEIDLPFHLLNTSIKPIINLCPLKLTTFRKDRGDTYSTMNAIEILTRKEADRIKLPNKFKKAYR